MEKYAGTVIGSGSGEYTENEDGTVLNTLLLPAQKDLLKVVTIFAPQPLSKTQNKKEANRLVQSVSIRL